MKKNQISPKKIIFSEEEMIFSIDIFGGKKSGEGIINLGDEMISLGLVGE